MTNTEFNEFLETILTNIKETLQKKEKEYSSGQDRFYSFQETAAEEEVHPLKALDILKSKHRICEKDLTRDVINGYPVPEKEYLREKIGDQINYLILKWAMLEQMRRVTGTQINKKELG